jgi:hypothetical protein
LPKGDSAELSVGLHAWQERQQRLNMKSFPNDEQFFQKEVHYNEAAVCKVKFVQNILSKQSVRTYSSSSLSDYQNYEIYLKN